MYNQKCIVHLQYGSYSGDVEVLCNEDDDIDYIIARAFKQAECNFLSMCLKTGKIISREYLEAY